MDRLHRALTAGALALAATGCGDPLVVLGDSPGLMRIVAGVGDSIGSRVDSVAVRARLTQPSAVVFDDAAHLLFVADRGALRQIQGITRPVARIFSVTSAGRLQLLLDAGGCGNAPCIEQINAMTQAADGTLLIADGVGHRVLRYVPGGQVTVLAGTGVPGDAPDGARADQAPLNRPWGVAVGTDGVVYIAEAGGHRVRSVASDGVLRTVAGTGENGRVGDGGPAVSAQLSEPAGLLFADGELFIAEYGGSSVRVVDRSGVIRTIAGLGAPGFAGDDGPATAARLDRPVSLALAAGGRTLYVSDQGNDRVRAIDMLTGTIRTFAGTGSRTYTGNRRMAGETSLHAPAGIDAGGAGFVFIADAGHSVVWRTATTFF